MKGLILYDPTVMRSPRVVRTIETETTRVAARGRWENEEFVFNGCRISVL